MNYHTCGFYYFDFLIQACSGQPIVGDSIAEHASQGFSFFINYCLMPHSLQIIRSAQTTGSSADNGDPLSGRFCTGLWRHIAGMIDSIALDTADIDGIIQHVSPASRFTRMLTDIGTDGREGIILPYQSDSIGISSFLHQCDIAGNIHTGRTHGNTGNRLIQTGRTASVQDMLLIIIPKSLHTLQHHVGSLLSDCTIRTP